MFPIDRREELAPLMLKLAEIESTRRAFELTVDEVDRLGHAYLYIVEKHPEIGLYEYEKCNKITFCTQSSQMDISDDIDDIPDEPEEMEDMDLRKIEKMCESNIHNAV